jgi:hypothetical protein
MPIVIILADSRPRRNRDQGRAAPPLSRCLGPSADAIDDIRAPGEGVQLISEPEARLLLEQRNGPAEAFFETEEG